jgi:hypothetical protein
MRPREDVKAFAFLLVPVLWASSWAAIETLAADSHGITRAAQPDAHDALITIP